MTQLELTGMNGSTLIDRIWALDPEKKGEWAPDYATQHLSFKVVVPHRKAPRDPMFEHFVDLGARDAIAGVEGRSCGKASLTIFFPERHLSLKETHGFMDSLVKSNPQMRQLRLMTQSPVIITDFFDHQIVLFD